MDHLNSNLVAANITKPIFTTLPGATKTTGLKATVNYSGYNYVNLNFGEANSAYNFGKVSIDTLKRSTSNLYQINSGAGSGSGTTDGRGNILKIFIDGNTVSLTLGQLDSYSTTYGVFIDAWLSVF